jgi:hypothetical protein
MGKAPLFVRPLTDAAREALEAALRASNAFVRRRAHILLASARGKPVGASATRVGCSGQAVRKVIHAFHQEGLGVLQRRPSTPQTLAYCFDTPAAERLREIRHQRPRSYGKQTSVWTLELAADVAFEPGLTAWRVRDETVRATLARTGVRWQRAKHWISSPDPEYARKKARRDRLIRLAEQHADLLLGSLDAVWWRRLARPPLFAWQDDDRPLRLVEQTVPATDPDPKASACYGLLARARQPDGQRSEALWLRCVTGRPVSAVTIDFLAWCADEAAAQGKRAVLLIWDQASWQESQSVRRWLRAHNRQVKQTGRGARLIVSFVPVKSPWLHPIEPQWRHGKKRVAAPDRLLLAAELADRVCATYGCPHHPHLVQPPPKEAKAKSKKAA